MAISVRFARERTRQARQMHRNAVHVRLPHCAGEIHAISVSNNTEMAKLVGLKICLPSRRKTNLDAIANAAEIARTVGDEALSRRQREKPVMSGLSGSKVWPEIVRAHSHWVASAVAMTTAMLAGVCSKSSMPTP